MAMNAHPLSAELAEKLRVEILTEQLRSGEKLTEQALCDRYGVSRTPVREALKNLEAEGLVELVPNRGAFIVGLTDDDIRDLYDLRAQAEAQAVRWATLRRTEAEMDAIEESLDFMRFYTDRADAKRMRAINAGFHKRIAAASHNRMLIEHLSRVTDYIHYSARVRPYLESDLDVILDEHKAVFDAFRAGDAEAAAAAMTRHIRNSMGRAFLII